MDVDKDGYRQCANCHRKFEPQRWNQKYCVSNCKNANWNRKAKRIPLSLTKEERKQVEAIIAKRKLRDADSEPIEAR